MRIQESGGGNKIVGNIQELGKGRAWSNRHCPDSLVKSEWGRAWNRRKSRMEVIHKNHVTQRLLPRADARKPFRQLVPSPPPRPPAQRLPAQHEHILFPICDTWECPKRQYVVYIETAELLRTRQAQGSANKSSGFGKRRTSA